MWHSSERNGGLELSSKNFTPFLEHHCAFTKIRDFVSAARADEKHVAVVILFVCDTTVNDIRHEFQDRKRPCNNLCNFKVRDPLTIQHFVRRWVVIPVAVIVLVIINVKGLRLSPIRAANKLGCVVGCILLLLNENITDPFAVVVVPSLGLLTVLGAGDVAV